MNKGVNYLGVDGYCHLHDSLIAYFTDSRFSTVAEFKSFLVEQKNIGTPLTVVCGSYKAYNEKNPKTEHIDLPPLPKPQAKTMIYEVDTIIEPSNMYGKYIKKY